MHLGLRADAAMKVPMPAFQPKHHGPCACPDSTLIHWTAFCILNRREYIIGCDVMSANVVQESLVCLTDNWIER